MDSRILDLVMEYKEMPDIQAFAKKLAISMGKPDADPEIILEIMAQETFKGWEPEIDNYEWKKSRNWMRAFSLLFWTERVDGESDYHEDSLELMDILARYWISDSDFELHSSTRLLIFLCN
jgi:hypothetical protein